MRLIDTHTHIYGEEFDKDLNEVVLAAKQAGVERVYLPNIDMLSVDRVINLHNQDKDFFQMMMGLYPGSVEKNVQQQLDEIRPYVFMDEVVAIGEIGLDLYRDKTLLDEQIYAFNTQLQWSQQRGNMPMSIHCRKAFDEILMCLKQDNRKQFRGVFHCFSGDKRQADKVIEMGFKLGIGGVVTFKNSHLAEVVKSVDLKDIVLETDAPYLAPVPMRGKRNEPSFLTFIAQKIAEIKGITAEEVAEVTTQTSQQSARPLLADAVQ